MTTIQPVAMDAPPRQKESRQRILNRHIRAFLETNRRESEAFVQKERDRRHWFFRQLWRPSADACCDGRLSDFPMAIGLMPGILEMHRSGGAKGSRLESIVYMNRIVNDYREVTSGRICGDLVHPMHEMRFILAHHSHSRPDAGCAAWNCDLRGAVEAAKAHAKTLNDAFPKMLAFPAVVDTDTDALTVIGPRGALDMREYIGIDTKSAGQKIHRNLQAIFPSQRDPLARMNDIAAEAFTAELTELLLDNLRFVEMVICDNRPIELLDHAERLIFVGRPLETQDHNAAFLIGNGEIGQIRSDFAIGLTFVARNSVHDALQTGDEHWSIPVIVSIPHTGDDRMAMMAYARGLKRELMDVMREREDDLRSAIEEWPEFRDHLPPWLAASVDDLENRLEICVTVNEKATRLMVPIDV